MHPCTIVDWRTSIWSDIQRWDHCNTLRRSSPDHWRERDDFRLREWTLVRNNATTRWSLRQTTRSNSPNIFCTPSGTVNVSETYYDDALIPLAESKSVTIFATPEVPPLLDGSTWSLKMNFSCRVVNPLKEMRLLTFGGVDDFSKSTSGQFGLNSSFGVFGTDVGILAASGFDSPRNIP